MEGQIKYSFEEAREKKRLGRKAIRGGEWCAPSSRGVTKLERESYPMMFKTRSLTRNPSLLGGVFTRFCGARIHTREGK